MRVFFSAGEPSGDLHGANLIRRLREQQPNVECVGFGGPEMAAAGCELLADLTSLSVMWLLRALVNLHRFLALLSQADRHLRRYRPDAVVLIDYPGFNWWMARRAKAYGIPVFYYAPPQIWAWASHRVNKMRRLVDHVLCSLPFEAEWFAERGCNAVFVGHPYFDEVRRQALDVDFIAQQRRDPRPLVTLLPGSRNQEVEHNLEPFLRAAARIRELTPNVRFVIASFKPRQARMARELVEKLGVDADVFVRRTPELIHLADCCLAVSGSVSLELLYHAKPTVIHYAISPLADWLQKRFRRVRYITLVNLLTTDDRFPKSITPFDPHSAEAERVLFPEYLTSMDKTSMLAEHITQWLTDREARSRLVARLEKLRDEVGHGGAARSAASYILAKINRGPSEAPRPHFVDPGHPVDAVGELADKRNVPRAA